LQRFAPRSGALSDTVRAPAAVRFEHADAWQYNYTREYGAGRALLEWDATSNLTFALGVTAWNDESDVQAPQARELAFQTVNPAAANPVAIAALAGYPLAPNDPRAADWDPGLDFSQDNRFVQGTLRADWDLTDRVTLPCWRHGPVRCPEQRATRRRR
jgi:iron complex outermembrane receptor protein